ncbi:hypothetical protein D3C73_1522510 [compost metagenome]
MFALLAPSVSNCFALAIPSSANFANSLDLSIVDRFALTKAYTVQASALSFVFSLITAASIASFADFRLGRPNCAVPASFNS